MAELADFVHCEAFFTHCPRHAGCAPREAQLNFFDLSTHTACCALCVAAQPLDTYLQVGGCWHGGGRRRRRGGGARGGVRARGVNRAIAPDPLSF